jgi:hypothetical protein
VDGGFDAERYLRITAEDSLLQPEESIDPADSAPAEVAAALVAVGAMPVERAEDILALYGHALALRPGDHRRMRFGRSGLRPEPKPEALATARVACCDADLELPWGRLHVGHIVFSGKTTSLAVDGTSADPRSQRRGHHSPGQLQATISDDAGGSGPAHFSGSFGRGHWSGTLATAVPLSPTTRWLEIDGIRLDLPDPTGTAPEVRVESLAEQDPAANHLWFRLGTSGNVHHRRPPARLEAAIAALEAAGALEPGGPVVSEVRAVAAALDPNRGAGSARLPPRWASCLGPGTAPGARGTAAIEAVTPAVDGVALALDVLVTDEEDFALEVRTSPGISWSPFHLQLSGPRIVWWAEDDRGNSYLGSPNGWSSSDDQAHGTIAFSPNLDPRATELRLLPTGMTERAVITVTALPGRASA